MLAVFTFITIGGSLFYVQPAKAFPVEITWDPGYVWSVYKSFIKDAAVSISIQTFSYFLRRVAYDSAVWLASGGKGQASFAYGKNFGDYLKDVGDSAAGVAIEALGEDFGFNLCKIPDPKIDLAMRIGLTYKFMDLKPDLNTGPGVREPTCTWSTFQNDVLSVDNWQSQFGSSDSIARKFNVAFSVEQTDIGILRGATDKINKYVAKKIEAETLQRQEGEGYLPKTTLISGDILAPGKNISEEAQAQNPNKQIEAAQAGFLTTLGTGAVGTIASAGSIFFNTLASQMLKNWQNKGMLPFGIGCVAGVGTECKDVQDTLSNLQGQVSRGGRQAAQALFSDLLTPPNIAVDQYNVLVNFTNCPTSPGPDNCVADAGLAQAAQEANSGRTVTIAEALEKNWLHAEWRLVSPDRVADNVDPGCHQRAYCYANIAKLRKARILPLGFEIAALNSNPDQPWTLKQVVDGFNDCNFIRDVNGNVVGVDNDPVNKPFCRLIDPNWVLKAPSSKCNFMAYGTSPYFSGTPNRIQECVNMSTCVAYDKDGNCATQGYCTREKNVWKIDAAKCDSQNRTCRTFQDSTGKTVSYLYRTLDTGFCNQDTVGCAEYSLKQNTAGNWVGYAENDLGSLGENSSVYFNNKVSTNCSSNSDGCSSFQVANSSEKLYLKKAPYYSQCYDTDLSTAAIDWPRTASDLNRLPNKPACNNYSQACIADEVNCNWYSPTSYTGDNIPGKYTPATVLEGQIVWNDQCDARCVGYAAYREMPSNYSNGQPVSYIIPSSGNSCNAVDEGCASFTNLGTTEGGLEKVEHYSYLRPCILPDTTKQKTFFTYEGSAVGGFQLKSFVLEKDTDGSPKYFYRTADDLATYAATCSQSLYQQGLANPDCRQFNDDQGAVYYKLLSKTIAVASNCTPFRLNDTELHDVALNEVNCLAQRGKWDATAGSCQVCFQNGEYRDGECFYYGLPGSTPNTAGTSKPCAAAVNTCRAYKGNTGNNVRNIFTNNFEQAVASDALAGWGPSADIAQSLESTRSGEHSLSYNGTGAVYKDILLTPGESYDLTFWAKGAVGETVTVTLENNQVSNLGTISVGDAWQNYHLGPIELAGNVSSTKLQFAVNGRLFLDNVRLKEVADFIYLVKNSLSVDPVCDSNLNDNLPGEALGCSQYQTPDNRPIYLTGFTSLCREKAIGCTAVYDTRNTPDEVGPRAYNVWLSGPEGQSTSRNIIGTEYRCQVALGQKGCYVHVTGANLSAIVAGGGAIVTSTIYVQPDSPTTTPLYLVASREATCSPVDLGCTKAGKLVQTPTGPTYTEVIVKKDPSSFNTTLCQQEAVGCNAYSSSDGALYFKDPQYLGQKVCAYRDNITKNGVRYNGWFWKGVGKCGAGAVSDPFCTKDSDCAAGVTCNQKDEQPCYPNYLQSGNSYGLWSYGVSSSYNNFVGECPATQNGCTEFIDRNENNKTYYLINDDRLKTQQTECNGQISEKSGCILLDKTDSPNKLWNTAASYAASAGQNNNLVAPVAGTGTATNDANVILKVSRDRECGEWLQCRSSHRVFDTQSGSYKEVCDAIGRCNKSLDSYSNTDFINCSNWLDNNHELSNQILTDDAYRNRNTTWKGQDFSGYSILNTFPVEELSEVNVGNATVADWRLAKTLACGGGPNCRSAADLNSPSCRSTSVGLPCGRNNAGVCLGSVNPVCVQDLDSPAVGVPRQSIAPSCRAYPEETSPFPNSQAINESLAFNSVNTCNENPGFSNDPAKYNSCECNYTKVTYGDAITKYWNFSNPNNEGILDANNQNLQGVVSGICVGGDSADRACDSDSDCAGGSCQKLKKQSRLIGWQGYCVEPDLSRPLNAEQNSFACLTWFPKDNITGAFDINNQHVEAGFQATETNGKYYCLEAKGYQETNSNTAVNGTGALTYNKLLGGVLVDHNGSNNTTNREKRVIAVSSGRPIYRDEIDYILISPGTGGGSWFPNTSEPFLSFYIRNGLITKYNGPVWNVVRKNGNDPNEEIIQNAQQLYKEAVSLAPGQYVWSDGRDSRYWYIRHDDGQGDGNDHYQYADPYSAATGPFADLLRSDCAGSIDVNGRDDYQGACLGINVDDNDDGCAIRVVFDPDGRLNRVNLVCFTGDSAQNEGRYFNVYVGLREPCANIAQTETNPYTSVGWTDRLWRQSTFAIPTLNYRNSLISSPYGSLAMPSSLVPDKLINLFTHYNSTVFDPPPAVAGAPYSCIGTCLQTNPTAQEGLSGTASQRTGFQGQESLGQIFAKVDNVWNWGFSTVNSAWSYQANTSLTYNFTERSSDANAPQVRALGACRPGGKCLEGNVAGMSINDRASGDIVFNSNVGVVNAKFFGFANQDQMPIRKIKLDWGDGNVVSLDGYFRNQRGTVNGTCGSGGTCLIGSVATGKSCSSNSDCTNMDNCFAESQAPNFGQIAGKTCDSAYFRFDHVYQCSRESSSWTNSCPNAQAQSLYGGCCAFQPKVQLKDNWGWCNGTCTGGVGGNGCYDRDWGPVLDQSLECNSSGAYTPFAGRIIVIPND